MKGQGSGLTFLCLGDWKFAGLTSDWNSGHSLLQHLICLRWPFSWKQSYSLQDADGLKLPASWEVAKKTDLQY